MSQKDDDFTLQQRAKTKAQVPRFCCPQSLNAEATEFEIRQRHKTCVKQLLCCLHSEFSGKSDRN